MSAGKAPANHGTPWAADVARIEAQPVCVASSTWSAGRLGDVLLYVHRRVGNELHVGYFAYWSAERPWGDNALTYALLPALGVDVAYSHFLFVLPGLRQWMYGPGDIEGAAVTYTCGPDGRLVPLQARADDSAHRRVRLSRSEVWDQGRVILLTRVWSHQLGARGAAAYSRRTDARMRCFSGPSLVPLSADVAARFRLGSADKPLRARPAWSALGSPHESR